MVLSFDFREIINEFMNLKFSINFPRIIISTRLLKFFGWRQLFDDGEPVELRSSCEGKILKILDEFQCLVVSLSERLRCMWYIRGRRAKSVRWYLWNENISKCQRDWLWNFNKNVKNNMILISIMIRWNLSCRWWKIRCYYSRFVNTDRISTLHTRHSHRFKYFN